MPAEVSDQTLVEAIPQNGVEPLRELFRRFAPMMLAVACRILRRREDAEDVVNEVFLDLHSRPDAYSADRGSVQSYLLLVTRSRSIDRLRRRITRTSKEAGAASSVSEVASGGPRPDERIERDEVCSRVTAVMRELPQEEREALEQAFYDGLSHAEIAKQTNVPLGTVKGRVRRALLRLRGELLACYGGARR